MTVRVPSGVSRRGFLLTLAAACLVGARERSALKRLDDVEVRRMALWAG